MLKGVLKRLSSKRNRAENGVSSTPVKTPVSRRNRSKHANSDVNTSTRSADLSKSSPYEFSNDDNPFTPVLSGRNLDVLKSKAASWAFDWANSPAVRERVADWLAYEAAGDPSIQRDADIECIRKLSQFCRSKSVSRRLSIDSMATSPRSPGTQQFSPKDVYDDLINQVSSMRPELLSRLLLATGHGEDWYGLSLDRHILPIDEFQVGLWRLNSTGGQQLTMEIIAPDDSNDDEKGKHGQVIISVRYAEKLSDDDWLTTIFPAWSSVIISVFVVMYLTIRVSIYFGSVVIFFIFRAFKLHLKESPFHPYIGQTLFIVPVDKIFGFKYTNEITSMGSIIIETGELVRHWNPKTQDVPVPKIKPPKKREHSIYTSLSPESENHNINSSYDLSTNQPNSPFTPPSVYEEVNDITGNNIHRSNSNDSQKNEFAFEESSTEKKRKGIQQIRNSFSTDSNVQSPKSLAENNNFDRTPTENNGNKISPIMKDSSSSVSPHTPNRGIDSNDDSIGHIPLSLVSNIEMDISCNAKNPSGMKESSSNSVNNRLKSNELLKRKFKNKARKNSHGKYIGNRAIRRRKKHRISSSKLRINAELLQDEGVRRKILNAIKRAILHVVAWSSRRFAGATQQQEILSSMKEPVKEKIINQMVQIRFRDPLVHPVVKHFVLSSDKLTQLCESGLPSWAIFLNSYVGVWVASICMMFIGLYDLFSKVEIVRVFFTWLFGSWFQWFEETFVLRITSLFAVIIPSNSLFIVLWHGIRLIYNMVAQLAQFPIALGAILWKILSSTLSPFIKLMYACFSIVRSLFSPCCGSVRTLKKVGSNVPSKSMLQACYTTLHWLWNLFKTIIINGLGRCGSWISSHQTSLLRSTVVKHRKIVVFVCVIAIVYQIMWIMLF